MLEENDVRAALFDIDGTLTDGSPFWDVVIHAEAVSSYRRAELYVTTLPLYLLVKLRLSSQAAFRDRWVRHMARLLRGWSVTQVDAVCDRLVQTRLIPNLRADVVAIMREHQAAGRPVLLVSTMFSGVVAGLARYLGVDAGLGSEVEFQDGHCTGRIVGETCSGPRKVTAADRYFDARLPGVALAACAAYADSRSDIPLLESAGYPVAVYPDPEMRAMAEARGWTIYQGA